MATKLTVPRPNGAGKVKSEKNAPPARASTSPPPARPTASAAKSPVPKTSVPKTPVPKASVPKTPVPKVPVSKAAVPEAPVPKAFVPKALVRKAPSAIALDAAELLEAKLLDEVDLAPASRAPVAPAGVAPIVTTLLPPAPPIPATMPSAFAPPPRAELGRLPMRSVATSLPSAYELDSIRKSSPPVLERRKPLQRFVASAVGVAWFICIVALGQTALRSLIASVAGR